jgi:EAL domain-containing protein (putative c-di-GMP-specific phosphodiesterase class I)
VEDQETLEFLSGVGCDRVQGYWFARPMPGDQAYQWLEQHQGN